LSEHHGAGDHQKQPEVARTDSGGGDESGTHHEMAGMMRTVSDPAFAVTRSQLTAMTLLTILALVAGSLLAASQANLTVNAHQVGDVVMPPGMVMRRDLPADAMRDMAAVDPRAVRIQAAADARGDRPLDARLDGGVKVYELEAAVTGWNILPYVRMAAYAFNGQVPGPRIRITQGDRVRFVVRNSLPEPTTVHWHGLIVPNAMDGPAEITQAPIPPGGSFTYEFTAVQAGTFFYHSHAKPDRQQALGLYGALIIDPKEPSALRYDKELVVQLQEWLFKNGYTFPAMPMDGMQPNFFTINGKAYPSTETVQLRVGEKLLVRFIGSQSGFVHPMHIHGGPFAVVATDGQAVPESARIVKDTINVGPGERYDVIWEAREPGKWLLHCHINHHTTNDNREDQGAGGLTLILQVG
jgi:FtsP/CotA-like multicopper oxidase with cupredoxin domain